MTISREYSSNETMMLVLMVFFFFFLAAPSKGITFQLQESMNQYIIEADLSQRFESNLGLITVW